MTSQAKAKIQTLAKNPSFRISLEKFLKISEMYTNTHNKVPSYNVMRRPFRNMLNKIQNVDNLYIFRDKNTRFIFTLDKGKDDEETAILLDVLDKQEVRSYLKEINNPILR
ncbi:hypothetical protein [Pseudalkalibacillus decolorationis]|uniref:hypothetical protein n=1 Tax=Pseudalkalibacillus decolorationis TaxID=163879 RepID=UPI002148FC83|nr:hypothetical protein [Pseudalkalibacillus decolorationis]